MAVQFHLLTAPEEGLVKQCVMAHMHKRLVKAIVVLESMTAPKDLTQQNQLE